MARCPIILITPQKPTQIPTENITIDTTFVEDEITLIVNWRPPQHTNGVLTSYDVCLSENGLEGEEDCDIVSLFSVRPNDLPFTRSYTIQAPQLAVQVYILYWSKYATIYTMILLKKCHTFNLSIQVRAVNGFDLAGNWSEAVIIDTPPPNTTIITTTPTPPSSSEIPSWVYIVIALVIVAVLILVLVVGAVFVSRRYCFHRYSIKTVSHLSVLTRWRIKLAIIDHPL